MTENSINKSDTKYHSYMLRSEYPLPGMKPVEMQLGDHSIHLETRLQAFLRILGLRRS